MPKVNFSITETVALESDFAASWEMSADDAQDLLLMFAEHREYSEPVEDESAEGGYRQPTAEEMLDRYFSGIVNSTQSQLLRWRKRKAAEAAEAQVVEPVATKL